MSEKLSLQWNDFKDNIISSFGSLRKESDLADVTLVGDDGKQVDCHKLVLASSSPVFQNMLKENKHSHPLIYMRGLQSKDLFVILDFLYCGEASVYQEDLEPFFSIAEDLQIKGLVRNSNQEEVIHQYQPEIKGPHNADPVLKKDKSFSKFLQLKGLDGNSSHKEVMKRDQPKFENTNHFSSYSVAKNFDTSVDIEKLDTEINQMMQKTKRKNAHSQPIYACNIVEKKIRDGTSKVISDQTTWRRRKDFHLISYMARDSWLSIWRGKNDNHLYSISIVP